MNNDVTKTSPDRGLQLQFDFTRVSSTIVPDVSENGYTGVIRSFDRGGAVIVKEDIYGRPFHTLMLPGGEDGGYLELPRGILANEAGITISFWCKIIECKDNQTLFSFGKDTMLYCKILTGDDKKEVACIPCVSDSGQSQEQAADPDKKVQTDRWYQFCITLEPEIPSLFTFYLDGQLTSQLDQKKIRASALSKEDCLYFGKGIFGLGSAKVQVADFRIYNRVLPLREVRELFFVSDEDCIKADREYLKAQIPEEASKDLILPVTGPYGSRFSYSSKEEAYLTSEGKVKRPLPGKGDARVHLNVVISRDNINKKYGCVVRIKAHPSEEQLLQKEAESLNLNRINHIYEDIELPQRGNLGAALRWESSDALAVSPEGAVFRGIETEGKKTVIVTAVLSYNNLELRKPFQVKLLPEYKRKSITSIPLIKIETQPEVPPVLPNRIWIEYSDGTKKKELVFWSEVSLTDLKKKGDFTVKGYLKQYPGVIIPAYIAVRDGWVERKKLSGGFGLNKIVLQEDTIVTQNKKRTLNYLKLLDSDRMLYAFRAAFSVDTKAAKPLGGWDEPLGLLRGHSTGHYLSALAYAFSSTGDKELKKKIDYLIDSLKELQDLSEGNPSEFNSRCTKDNTAQSMWGQSSRLWGKGYLSAYPPDQFALLEEYATYPSIWAPYYTLHKILAGLLDCYEYGQNQTALTIACGIGNWVYERLSVCTRQQLGKMWSMYIAGEYGGMNEALARLYLITEDSKYIAAAALFDNHIVFTGLAKNKDTITSLHANQHIPQILGALKEYEATGDISYYRTAYYFWHLITKHYVYSIGGVGRGENFKEKDILAGHIEGDRNCETCAAYNMLKLTKELYLYEPENSEYMDYYEKTLFNQIIASQNPVITETMHHGVTYMLPIGPGQHKEYGTDYQEFTCCHGTGMENHVKYEESIYFKDLSERKVYINLYIPSILNWQEEEIVITQLGGFVAEKTVFTIHSSKSFTCCFRIPDWCRSGFRMVLNGRELACTETNKNYITLTRTWTEGDKLVIYTPYELALEYTPDDLDLPVASIFYGPFVMVGCSSLKEWITLILSPDIKEDFSIAWQEGIPVLSYEELRFIPMYAAHHVDYHTYFKIMIPYVE